MDAIDILPPNSAARATAGLSFASDATLVMRRLRAAVENLAAATPSGLQKSADLKKLMGLDIKLSWKIFKLAGPGDPLSLAPHVPSPASMRRFISAVKKHGLPAPLIAEVSAAYEEFDNLVSNHA